jgi:hypothetical protein
MIIQGLTLDGGFQLDPPTPAGLSKFATSDIYYQSQIGAVHVFDADGSNEVIIPNPTGRSDDNFGRGGLNNNIALNTTKVAVGANSARKTGAGNPEFGAAYLFNHDGTGGQQITASNGAHDDRFGSAVALTETKLVVGSYKNNNYTGAVYTYNLDGTGEQYIACPVTDLQMGDGVDAHGDKFVAATRAGGAAFVFNTDGTGEVVLTSSDGTDGDQFGTTVAINSTKVVVGARYNSNYAGAVYVYNHDGSGEIKINYPGSDNNAGFGSRVSCNENKIVILATDGPWICNLDGTGLVQVSNQSYSYIDMASDKILGVNVGWPNNPQFVDIMDYTGSNLLRVNNTGISAPSGSICSLSI